MEKGKYNILNFKLYYIIQGKDSGLALSIACENSEIVALINCCEQKHPMFHQHDMDLMELQSKSLKIPIAYSNGHWKESHEIETLLKEYKAQGVEFVVFGDICSIKNANRKVNLFVKMSATNVNAKINNIYI